MLSDVSPLLDGLIGPSPISLAFTAWSSRVLLPLLFLHGGIAGLLIVGCRIEIWGLVHLAVLRDVVLIHWNTSPVALLSEPRCIGCLG